MNLIASHQGRQDGRDVPEHLGMTLKPLLLFLNGLPVAHYLFSGISPGITENMGVPVDHFSADAGDNVLYAEFAPLTGNPGMKDHLQQNIPQFLGKLVHILHGNGLQHLIGLLNKVLPEGLVILFPVPGAAFIRAKDFHNLDQVTEAVVFQLPKLQSR